MSEATTVVGQPISLLSLPVAASPADDDYLVTDGATNGTRRMLANRPPAQADSARLAALEARVVAMESRLLAAEQILQRLKDIG